MKNMWLLGKLEQVGSRYRWYYAWMSFAVGWFAASLLGLALHAGIGRAAWVVPVVVAFALLATVVALVMAVRAGRDYRWIARRIEAEHRDLDSVLLAAVEQEPDLPGGRFGYLQDTVIREALAHGRHHDWLRVISKPRLRMAQIAGIAALVFLGVVVNRLGERPDLGTPGDDAAAVIPPPAAIEPYEVTVQPGDTEIERGTSLIVTARFAGSVPDEAHLVYTETSSGETVRMPMTLSLSDPLFGARIARVDADLSYRVSYGEEETRAFHVTVFETPRLTRADAKLVFPAYTSLPEKWIEDTRRVTAVEGTELTLRCCLNKAVTEARLEDGEGRVVQLHPEEDLIYTTTMTLTSSTKYRLHLTDGDGRKNKHPPEFVIVVTPNRPPDVKITMPSRDVRVSPIEELDTKASVWDDYGLIAYGLDYGMAGGETTEVTLGGQAPVNERRTAEHVLDFESFGAEPDQLLSYYFWADDIGPDGATRRTYGDMYFAEVRHFEEIFRQGQQPAGGEGAGGEPGEGQGGQGGGAVRQALELAEKQKEIINATWKIIRRETGPEPTEAFAGDAGEVLKAQREALEQVERLAGQLEDASSKEHAAAVTTHMNEAIEHLTRAAESGAREALRPALAAEQAAYQGLLKLRAREFEVIRSNERRNQRPSASASGPQSRAQRQLDQLELSASENRYETQRTAQSREATRAQQEAREVSSRLRDLARRQQDLTDRIKELQSALAEAKTEEERQEIERQLKRLRDRQQELVQSLDEVAERMARPENQEQMAEARERLEGTRENMQRARDAIDEGRLSQAAASGARAERELDELREELRRDAAGRYAERARELRDDARRLSENERQLGERLGEASAPQTKRLRDRADREDLLRRFRQQQSDLEELLTDMRTTIEEAEEAEPVMTQRLYDTLRRARQQSLDEALEQAGGLVESGFLEEARPAEAQARQGIDELREGVERAAESVLGDDTEALRRARDTLTELARDVDREIADATGEEEARRGEGSREDRELRGDEQGEQDRQGTPRPGANVAETDRQGGRQGTPRPGDNSEEADRQGGRQGTPQPDGNVAETDRQGGQRGMREPDGARNPDGFGGGLDRFREDAGGPGGPIAGDDFLRWSDRLRDVEEMLEEPDLRADAGRIRDRAADIRRELRARQFKAPNWDIVREFVAEPLNELRDRVAEELLRRTSRDSLVPIDRDPVPPGFAERVRRYYERLGSGK